MKRSVINFIAFLLLSACARENQNEQFPGKWNGYDKYLKTGEVIHTLWAGQNINIGTVTYGLDDNANFYATYDCMASGWQISETHLYAGDKALMPLNKPGAPRVGNFPFSNNHSPRVSTFTYRIPLAELPPCASPGFVVASHCVAFSPYGQKETAWAEGNYTFSDKGWGWYDTYYYDPPANTFTVLYGTSFKCDTLRLYHVDITTSSVQLMLEEYVGNSAGTYDGAAYSTDDGLLLFTKVNTNELWLNRLQGDEPSFCAGQLSGTAKSGTYSDGSYYYVDDDVNSINEVSFTGDWLIAGESALDTIPGQVEVNDIAMNPDGDKLFILGQRYGSGSAIITWGVNDHSFYQKSVSIPEGAQISFGSDGRLYAIGSFLDGDSTGMIYEIIMPSDSLTVVTDDIIILEDPFTDLASGPSF